MFTMVHYGFNTVTISIIKDGLKVRKRVSSITKLEAKKSNMDEVKNYWYY